MKTVGIIAEYNPFHEGHAYHIAEAKRRSGADRCIVVMSGYFVQRGEPAVYDPSRRVNDALKAGADAVFAMPALFSCASAEQFAAYGVGLLEDLGCDAISFGVESWDEALYSKMTDIISQEPEPFKTVLKERLKAGESFAAARMQAVRACLTNAPAAPGSERTALGGEQECTEMLGSMPMIDGPNNILALEYMRAMKRANSSMQVVAIERVGHGYHDETLDGTENGGEPSAECGCDAPCSTDHSTARPAVYHAAYPSATALRKKLREEHADGCLFVQDMWPMMLSVIMRKIHDGEDLTVYADVSSEIANRIAALIGRPCCASFDAFTSQLKTRQYAYTRIARCLMHIFLDHKAGDIPDADDAGRYALLLGFRRESGGLLAHIKEKSRVPIISKAADAVDMIDAQRLFENEVYASRLYAAAYMCKYGKALPDLYTSRIVVYP